MPTAYILYNVIVVKYVGGYLERPNMLRQTGVVDFGKRNGLKVHPVSIGGMRLLDEEQAIPLLRQAKRYIQLAA